MRHSEDLKFEKRVYFSRDWGVIFMTPPLGC